MAKTQGDDNAFPSHPDISNDQGLTKREHMATAIAAGLAAAPRESLSCIPGNRNICDHAVDLADDLIEALNKPKGGPA